MSIERPGPADEPDFCRGEPDPDYDSREQTLQFLEDGLGDIKIGWFCLREAMKRSVYFEDSESEVEEITAQACLLWIRLEKIIRRYRW